MDTTGKHTLQRFDDELESIRSNVLTMGGLTERQIDCALQALIDSDSAIAEEVLVREKQINAMEVDIDDEIARFIAKRQPAASDLRLILVISKIVRDLERASDEAKKIAKLAVQGAEEGAAPRGYVETRHIGNTVRLMIHDALDAFVRVDNELALNVVQRDKEVDQEYRAVTRQLITYMMEDPRSITRVLNVMWSLRGLERVGDHAANIAENVFYLSKGEDLRHTGLSKIRDKVKGWES